MQINTDDVKDASEQLNMAHVFPTTVFHLTGNHREECKKISNRR